MPTQKREKHGRRDEVLAILHSTPAAFCVLGSSIAWVVLMAHTGVLLMLCTPVHSWRPEPLHPAALAVPPVQLFLLWGQTTFLQYVNTVYYMLFT